MYKKLALPRGNTYLGNTWQDLVDVFLLRADANQQMDEWHAAKKFTRICCLWVFQNGFVGGTVHTCAWRGVHLLFGEMVAKITQYTYVTTAVWGLSIFYGIFGPFVFSAGSTKNALLSFSKEIRTPSVPQQRQCYMKDQMLLQYARL